MRVLRCGGTGLAAGITPCHLDLQQNACVALQEVLTRPCCRIQWLDAQGCAGCVQETSK